MAPDNQTPASVSDEPVVDEKAIAAFLAAPEGTEPAQTPSSTPAVAPQQPAAPLTVVIGGETLTPEQIEARLKAPALPKDVQDKLGIADAFLALPPDQRQMLADTAAALTRGENPFKQGSDKTLVVNEVDIPAGTVITPVPWADMSDGERQLYALLSAVRDDADAKIKELTGIVSGMKQFVGQLHTQSQDEKMAQALRLKGFVSCTAEDVQAYRASGISDPLKAAEAGLITPPKATEKKADEPAAPEAPNGNAPKFFDSNDPSLTMDSINRLLKAGYLPKDKKEREKLLASRAKAS